LAFCVCGYGPLHVFWTVDYYIRDGARLNVVLKPDMKRPFIPFVEVVVESFFLLVSFMITFEVVMKACQLILIPDHCSDGMTRLIALTIYSGRVLHPRTGKQY